MKRDNVRRHLRMGCGEGLVGRVTRFCPSGVLFQSLRRAGAIARQTGRGKR